MSRYDVAIIGGGPGGLCAAITAAESGSRVLLIDRNKKLGGQLIKQTHMFFGSEKQYASMRGIDIVKLLLKKIENNNNITIMRESICNGIYEDGTVTILQRGISYKKFKPKTIIVASGASEKMLAFANNDLPGIFGAGGVQTLMNVYGVKPGQKVLMIGAGNIGLIVSYQLIQAGVEVVGIVEASSTIGGYLVHASKVRRMGVPIYTNHTVKEAIGADSLEKAVIWQLDEKWSPVEGTEKEIEVDSMCVSVGLSPLSEILGMAGCDMKYIRELSGEVPVRNNKYQTSIENIFVAGDVCGVEEASSAMVEGHLAGLCASEFAGNKHESYDELLIDYNEQLGDLRSGVVGDHIMKGINKIVKEEIA